MHKYATKANLYEKRRKGNETEEESKQFYERNYVEAKELTQSLVNKAMTNFELHQNKRNIRRDRSEEKKWLHIEKLLNGGKMDVRRDVTMCDEDGSVLDGEKKTRSV